MQLKFYSPVSRIRDRKERSRRLEERLQNSMEQTIRRRRHSLDLYIERMRGLSPLEKLKSGFSYVEDGQGRNIRSVENVIPGQDLLIRVQDGNILTRVQRTEAVGR